MDLSSNLPEEEDEAAALGVQACLTGKNPSDNPYASISSSLATAWAQGFSRERLKALRGQPL